MPDINNPQITAQLSVPQVDNHEAEMARADLYKMAKYSMKLFQMIQEGQELEGWVQAKITKASDYVSSIYHYMEYQMKFGHGGGVTELEDLTREADTTPEEPAIEEADDEVEMKEGASYEERLHALLEAKIKKESKKCSKKESKMKPKGKKVNEVSDETLTSYKEKAKKSADELEKEKKFGKALKRRTGVLHATSKMVGRAGEKLGKLAKA